MSIARAHRSGRESERIAARSMDASGRASSNMKAVASVVREHQGYTAGELHAKFFPDWELQEVRRRLTDAAKRGLVRCGRRRACRARSTEQVTWWA